MNELFTKLFKEVFDSISELKDLDGFDIKTEETPNGISISVVQKPQKKEDEELKKFIEEFTDYVKNTDNFIFDDAVEMFNEVSDIPLVDFQRILTEGTDKKLIMDYGECFKNCIKAIARDFVDEISEKYGL